MTNIVPFQSPLSDGEFCVNRVRQDLPRNRVRFDQPHFRDRLRERDITMRQVLATIEKGDLIDGPKLDQHGDWRIKLKRYVAGRKVQIVLAVSHAKSTVITVI